MSTSNKVRLGKGLEALIPKTYFSSGKTISNIPLLEIKPSPYQPRKIFNEESMATLVASIKKLGVAQPILVRRVANYYELVAGERRYRASIEAGLETIPAIVKHLSDRESLEIALIENLHREDLNIIEIAQGYQRLIEDFGLTHQDLSDIFGKSRPAISNALRLLNLPQEIQAAICTNKISEGHGRAMLSLKNSEEMLQCLQEIIARNLNVRQVERLVSSFDARDNSFMIGNEILPWLKSILIELTNNHDLPFKVKGSEKSGALEIKYKTEDELNKILGFFRN
ncbi:ParB/RepB/Spo0J family partition protein [Candidatus Margulisiibacteriota bacterium]